MLGQWIDGLTDHETTVRGVIVWALALVLLGGCDLVVVVAPYQLFSPPERYHAAWQEVTDCAWENGVGPPYQDIGWFVTEVVHASAEQSEHFTARGGVFIPSTDILLDADHVDDVVTVTHEMVHYARQARNHKDPAFKSCVLGVWPPAPRAGASTSSSEP